MPDVILLMSGTNGFDAESRDRLLRTIVAHFDGWLFVATIPPQCPPRAGFEQVDAYNASLGGIVTELAAAGKRIAMVDIHAALTTADLLSDGVHPSAAGMLKMAERWFLALSELIQQEAGDR